LRDAVLNTFTSEEALMDIRSRPQFLWLLVGPVLGGLAGAATGAVVTWVMLLVASTSSLSPADLATGLAIGLGVGGIYGGLCGVVVGFVVGIPLVFLVGTHLPRDVAVRRARLLGAALPPLALATGSVALFGGPLSWPTGEGLWVLLPLACSALSGSRLAAGMARSDSPRAPVS
jgi:hypothetical protein